MDKVKWERSTLGSFATVIGGGTPSRTQGAYWRGDIPWASVKDFDDETVILDDTVEHISEAGLLNSAANLVPENTPVVCTRMAVGRCALTSRPTAINQDLKAFMLTAAVDVHFFIRMLRFHGPILDRISVGSTVRGITLKDLLSLEVYHPSTTDAQARIAYVLDTIDEAIQKTEAVIAKLKQIRAGMLHDLLTYGLHKDGKLRDPVAHPEQFKDSELGRIPKEWEVATLGDALSMQAGDFLSSDRILSDGDYPVYGGNGIRGYTSIFNTQGPLALIGRQGALCGNVLIASGRFYATEHAVVVRPRTEMDVHWLAAYLIRMDLNRYSESSAQPGLSVNKLSYRYMLRPPFPEQALIGSALVSVEHQLDSEQRKMRKSRMVKSGLMDNLLSGDVPVPEDLFPEGVPA